MAGVGTWELADALSGERRETTRDVVATVKRIAQDGTVWVDAGDGEFPAERATASFEVGESVTVRIEGGSASVNGNLSDPSASGAKSERTAKTASKALSNAAEATAAANVARQMAESATRDAATAKEKAQEATDSAAVAEQQAASAVTSATEAKASAAQATTAARDALVQLGTVQDVVGTATWLAEHAVYAPTSDAEVDPSKAYYSRTGSGTQADPYVYAPVASPTDEGVAGYYERNASEAVSAYVASHLALTDEGLYVLADGSGYRLLVASGGVSVIDPDGHVVVTYGASVSTASDRAFSIGNDDAYILFTPATDAERAKVTIGGGNVQLGSSRKLSDWEAQLAQASSDAADAKQAALDGAFLVITSTNGQLFKNGSESTVLQAVVFPNGGERCETIEQVRERFGAGAYIEWRWKHEGGEWGTLVSSDAHISRGGMWLTVTPDDVASKTSFSASLVVP